MQDLEVLVCYGGDWPGEYNAVLTDKHGSLYLADVRRWSEVRCAGEWIPLEEATSEVLAKVTLKEALAWSVRSSRYADDWMGSHIELLEMALEALP